MRFKPTMSFWQIINMNVGFFGIQYSFGLQQNAISPIYTYLGADPDQLPILNLAGPMTGLLIQPIIGALSDKTWSPTWGRRKPYFLIGAVLCSICLFAFPFSSTLWMAAGLLWVLDAGNNTAMEPYRAFVADKLPEKQHGMGFLTQSFFTGLGITLASASIFVFQKYIPGKTDWGIPYWAFGSFFVGGFCSIASVLWSVYTTPEHEPSTEEMDYIALNPHGMWQPFVEIAHAIQHMPAQMWRLALVYLFQWYALFCYWQFNGSCVAQTIWGVVKKDGIKLTETETATFGEASAWASLVNSWYNVVTFLSAFGLVWLARKYSPRSVHFVCLIMAGLALLVYPHITDKYLLFAPMTGFGIAWASMMGVPYLLVSQDIPKERFGVYMGIINMMIVIPMIIQTLTFGSILKHFLGNNPANAITFGGVLLLIAAILVLRLENRQVTEVKEI